MLTESQREAVLLVYFGGRTYREVGEALNSTAAAVSADIRDGMTQLRSTGGVTGARSCLPPAR
ncbi:sigma-70-like protein [Saccharothrix carnea]|uniref:Sigma-70-like protein n=1 Tax=Saccharothrix carnea TaxID=1280637 RepID=A0A2P8HZA9_SACCR|nr:sigma-70-like protein [Saccharothrix carnea]